MFEVAIEVEEKRVADLLMTGFQGSFYWAQSVFVHPGPVIPKYSWVVDYPNSCIEPLFTGYTEVKLYERVGNKKKYQLNQATIGKGLELMANHHPKHWSQFMAGNEDVVVGDIFLQLCLFGKIVYG